MPVLGRRLEEQFDGHFDLEGPDGPRRLPIRGVVDRIDLLTDGTLRVIDYKSSLPPAAMQLRDLRRDGRAPVRAATADGSGRSATRPTSCSTARV